MTETERAMSAEKGRLWAIEYRIVGTFTVQAASAEAAQLLFDQLSAEELISNGYDDIEVFDPQEVKVPKEKT